MNNSPILSLLNLRFRERRKKTLLVSPVLIYTIFFHSAWRQFVPNSISDNASKATTRPKRQLVPSDNSSQATIRPKFQKATIRPKFHKRQLVQNDNSSKATTRPKRQLVQSDNSSQVTIRPKRRFVPNPKKRQFVPNSKKRQFVPNSKKRQFVPNDDSSRIP